MKKVLIAVLALSFMAVTSGLVLADGTTPTTGKKHHPKHTKKSHKKSADKATAPASTPAATK